MTALPEHAVQQIVYDAMNAASLAYDRIAAFASDVAASYSRPSIMLRPRLTIDGDQWCALYGENLQDGVAGFGPSPDAAFAAFDRAWSAALTNTRGDK